MDSTPHLNFYWFDNKLQLLHNLSVLIRTLKTFSVLIGKLTFLYLGRRLIPMQDAILDFLTHLNVPLRNLGFFINIYVFFFYVTSNDKKQVSNLLFTFYQSCKTMRKKRIGGRFWIFHDIKKKYPYQQEVVLFIWQNGAQSSWRCTFSGFSFSIFRFFKLNKVMCRFGCFRFMVDKRNFIYIFIKLLYIQIRGLMLRVHLITIPVNYKKMLIFSEFLYGRLWQQR